MKSALLMNTATFYCRKWHGIKERVPWDLEWCCLVLDMLIWLYLLNCKEFWSFFHASRNFVVSMDVSWPSNICTSAGNAFLRGLYTCTMKSLVFTVQSVELSSAGATECTMGRRAFLMSPGTASLFRIYLYLQPEEMGLQCISLLLCMSHYKISYQQVSFSGVKL